VTDVLDQSLWLHYRWLVTANCALENETASAPGMKREMRSGLLEEEIEWLREFRRQHHDCKYVLLALIAYVRLLQAVRREPHDAEEDEEADEEAERNELREWVDTLIRVDPMRKGRYESLGKYFDGVLPMGSKAYIAAGRIIADPVA
jgi:geranylgeranyl transferase type-2 subunit alpha